MVFLLNNFRAWSSLVAEGARKRPDRGVVEGRALQFSSSLSLPYSDPDSFKLDNSVRHPHLREQGIRRWISNGWVSDCDRERTFQGRSEVWGDLKYEDRSSENPQNDDLCENLFVWVLSTPIGLEDSFFMGYCCLFGQFDTSS